MTDAIVELEKNNLYLSVVIATYNRSELVRKCIMSLFDQTYSGDSYEIIIVDDGSTDDTEGLVRELHSISPVQLSYFKQENKGPAAARNSGIKNAKGEIIAFIDSDAVADKKWLESFAKYFNNHDVAGVGGRIIPYGCDETPFASLVEIRDNYSATSNVAYRRSVLLKVGLFDESLQCNEDTDLAFRVLQSGRKIVSCQRAVVSHISREKSFLDILTPLFRGYDNRIHTYKRYFTPENLTESSWAQRRIHPFLKPFFKFRLTGELMYVVLIPQLAHLNRWKLYLFKHPWKIPKFIAMRIADCVCGLRSMVGTRKREK